MKRHSRPNLDLSRPVKLSPLVLVPTIVWTEYDTFDPLTLRYISEGLFGLAEVIPVRYKLLDADFLLFQKLDGDLVIARPVAKASAIDSLFGT